MIRFNKLSLLLPAWIVFVFYIPSLTHGYVWDDVYFLTDMPYLRDSALWWRHILEPLFVSHNYFRPLPLLMYVAEARIGNLDPFVFHFVNVVLHALNTLLLTLLARQWLRHVGVPWAAAMVGLLFGLHPALVENVSWISDRFDLLMVSFILLALLCEGQFASCTARIASIAILFFLAMLSKETSVLLLVLLPLWQLARHLHAGGELKSTWQLVRNNFTLYGALLLVFCAYLALRHTALGFFYQGDAMMAPGTLLQHLLLIGKTLGWYAYLLIWPFTTVGPVHPAQTPIALSDAWAWVGLGGAVAVGLGLLHGMRRGHAAAVLGLMALVALAPVSNLLPLTIGDNVAHDRYLILPLAFTLLGVAAYLSHWIGHVLIRKRLAAACAVWLLAAAVSVSITIPHWESNLSLWQWAYAHHPDSRIARDNYVAALVNAGHNEETVRVCQEILKQAPKNASIHHNLSLALAELGQYDDAAKEAKQALALYVAVDAKTRLDVSEALNLLGYIRMRQERWSAAEDNFRQAVELTPYLTRAHYNLAMVLYQRSAWAEGDAELAYAMRYDSPAMAAAHGRKGEERKRALQQKKPAL